MLDVMKLNSLLTYFYISPLSVSPSAVNLSNAFCHCSALHWSRTLVVMPLITPKNDYVRKHIYTFTFRKVGVVSAVSGK